METAGRTDVFAGRRAETASRVWCLVGRQHHEAEHGPKEQSRMNKEACRCRETGARSNWNRFAKNAIHDTKCFWVCKNDEDKHAVEAIFHFEEELVPCASKAWAGGRSCNRWLGRGGRCTHSICFPQ